jgi:hypothetical protein
MKLSQTTKATNPPCLEKQYLSFISYKMLNMRGSQLIVFPYYVIELATIKCSIALVTRKQCSLRRVAKPGRPRKLTQSGHGDAQPEFLG